jgi:hypothetical protein
MRGCGDFLLIIGSSRGAKYSLGSLIPTRYYILPPEIYALQTGIMAGGGLLQLSQNPQHLRPPRFEKRHTKERLSIWGRLRKAENKHVPYNPYRFPYLVATCQFWWLTTSSWGVRVLNCVHGSELYIN